MTGNKWFVTKTENNPSLVVLFLKGLSITGEVSWGNIPDSSELVAGIVSSSYTLGLSHTLLHPHKHITVSQPNLCNTMPRCRAVLLTNIIPPTVSFDILQIIFIDFIKLPTAQVHLSPELYD